MASSLMLLALKHLLLPQLNGLPHNAGYV